MQIVRTDIKLFLLKHGLYVWLLAGLWHLSLHQYCYFLVYNGVTLEISFLFLYNSRSRCFLFLLVLASNIHFVLLHLFFFLMFLNNVLYLLLIYFFPIIFLFLYLILFL